jgi:hypothetical protein
VYLWRFVSEIDGYRMIPHRMPIAQPYGSDVFQASRGAHSKMRKTVNGIWTAIQPYARY